MDKKFFCFVTMTTGRYTSVFLSFWSTFKLRWVIALFLLSLKMKFYSGRDKWKTGERQEKCLLFTGNMSKLPKNNTYLPVTHFWSTPRLSSLRNHQKTFKTLYFWKIFEPFPQVCPSYIFNLAVLPLESCHDQNNII